MGRPLAFFARPTDICAIAGELVCFLGHTSLILARFFSLVANPEAMHLSHSHLPTRLYVAATSQHVGKTTTTLGLIAALQAQGLRVGYCKPVGQKYVEVDGARVDKDAQLFADYLGFQLEPSLHSPVILGPGVVTDYLDAETPPSLHPPVRAAAAQLEASHDIVVYEGTGHPGVGSVVGASNADVAQLLGSGVILVVEGGIGSTLDMLALNMALFQARQVPILGVIVNKTHPAKLAKVRHYLTRKLEQEGIPLLGLLPYEEELALPLLQTVVPAVRGRVLHHPERLNNRIRGVISASQIQPGDLRHQLLVVSNRRLPEAIARLRQLPPAALTGILLTGAAKIAPADQAFVRSHELPVIYSPLDTYEAVTAVSRIEVKIQSCTPWKVQRAVDLFRTHVDLRPLLRPAVWA